MHVIESQAKRENRTITFTVLLSEAIQAANVLISINGSTPYQALIGRQPAMLPPLEGGHTGQVQSMARGPTQVRHEARVREVVSSSCESHVTGSA